jgi:excinuclease ABC subunit C
VFNIKEQLKKLPERPGVYLMKDQWGNIIYIGKAKILKNRVTSYFRGIESHPPKVRALVTVIDEFEYIMTDTEMEALILEQTLIKHHKPKFNILLKDDKQYPFIKVTTGEKYPRVFMTRQVLKDKALYFGPYTSADAVKKTLEVIHDIYPIRKCARNIEKTPGRPCLNFHIKKCLGPCQSNLFEHEYKEMIDKIITFLSGKPEELVKQLEQQMMLSAQSLEYEHAAKLRDQIQAIQSLMQRQKMVAESDVSQDLIGIQTSETRACIMLFMVRFGKLIGREEYVFEQEFLDNPKSLLTDFVLQYYANASDYPKEIVLDMLPDDLNLYEDYTHKLSGTKIKWTVPVRGEKRKLLDMLHANAKEYLDKFEEKITSDFEKASHLESLLMNALGVKTPIRRIEAYDISNIYGVLSVGSMVVFENGKKMPRSYRRFKIKTVEGANDYASMQEIVFRRLSRGLEEQESLMQQSGGLVEGKFSVFPDLLLIDGGIGHVHAVEEVLKALKIDIPVAGMVKDDRHRTDQLFFMEHMIAIKREPDLYRYIATIQEEVHRFAIEYHKQLRTKNMMQSILEDIEGIGEKRRTNLLKHFKAIEKIKIASIEELEVVDSMNRKAAEKVYEHFRKPTKTQIETENSDEDT